MILQEEKEHLAWIQEKLVTTLEKINARVKEQARDLYDSKKYLYENKDGMDRLEKVSVRETVIQGAMLGEKTVLRRENIQKLLDSPYFARIDFSEKGKKETNPLYIGIHSFYDEQTSANLVYDWRAPVSGMFYDFELGPAFYNAPGGRVKGNISLKRQYRIRQGKMEYMLENAAQVYDEVLQQELSKASDSRMKNIVATIQRDQNPIVRNESDRVLIIQGVAGSGKTSIALHRIAYLLYRFRETLSSDDILIISPNKVYADYIANVLPELGEERIPEMGMEELAAKVLENKYKFQTFFEQVSLLIEKDDQALADRIRFKTSSEMLSRLDQFLLHVNTECFHPADFWIGKSLVPGWFISEKFESLHRLPIMKRFVPIAKAVEENIRFYYKRDVSPDERKEILREVTRMFSITNLRQLYRAFFDWLGKPYWLKMTARSRYEYADVFPLAYLKIRFEGFPVFEKVKHLLIDEMQDYSPVQYAVIARLFPCNKTILGDAHQKVSLNGSSTAETITEVMQDARVVKLRRSYRSSFEITQFAQQILPDSDLIAIERHGHKPVVQNYPDSKSEIRGILEQISQFRKSGYHSLGLICKTQKQADRLYHLLEEQAGPISRITDQSVASLTGVIVTTVHLSKGLEFDQVIVPFATAENYHTELDRHLLYIACTRAMHLLWVSFVKKGSGLLKPA
ncbi:MAG: HelD family protein [Bacteroidota bacterium]